MNAMNRRDVLKYGAVTVATTATATGCGFFSTNASSHKSSAATKGYKGKEAPMLAARVKAGKLPALKDRLPAKPAVLKPLDSAGVFGGTMHRTIVSADTRTTPTITHGLLEWDPVNVTPVAGLAESWEITDGGKTATFHLRKGLRWSDGHPFTTADLMFVWKSIMNNATLSPVAPTWITTDGKPPVITKVDDLTLRMEFAGTMALLLELLAFHGADLIAPEHYLKQFHPDYVSKTKLNAVAKKAGFGTWDKYFVAKEDFFGNPERPVMDPWLVTKPLTPNTTQAAMERNPYYWKTDPDGRQLPYIDKVTFDVLDAEATALRAASGQVDLQTTNISFKDVPLMARNAKSKGYFVRHWQSDAPWIAMYMNQYAKDPVQRKLLQNKDFRAALSQAINRKEMNTALYGGQGGYVQPCGIPQDPYYVKGSGKTFIDYDVDKANKLLDGIGLDKRDGSGNRLRSDGKTLQLLIQTFDYETGVAAVDAYEYVVRYWQKIGVKASVKKIDQTLWLSRVATGDVDIAGYTVAGFLWDVDPEWYVPVATNSYWAPLYGQWYSTNGKQGQAPPPEIHQLMQWYDQMKVETDQNKRTALGQQILKAHDENVWMIGTVTEPFTPLIVNADLHNVRETAVESYRLGHEQSTLLEQVYYAHPDQH